MAIKPHRLPHFFLWLPHHWPFWLGVGLLRSMILLPYPWAIWIGETIGLLLGSFPSKRRQVAAINIKLCFPELDHTAQKNLVRAHFKSVGAGLIETVMAWWGSEAQLKKRVKIRGQEHLDAALAQGRGMILLGAHFTTLELGGRFLAMHCPHIHFGALYRKHQHPVIEYLVSTNREKRFGAAINRDDIKMVIKSLKKNYAVWYAPDQHYGHKNRVFVPFFNIPASTNPYTARLAKISHAPVIPFFTRRLADATYIIDLLPPLENYPSEDLIADTRRMNALIEEKVRLAPEQYFWVHRRFKSQPDADVQFYPK